MLDAAGQALRERLLSVFAAPFDEPLADAEFDALARAAFAYQFARNLPYAAYCRSRGRTPDRVRTWDAIPPVPTAAFKHLPLVAGRTADAEAVFRTSGTTHGSEKRGTHYLLDLSLYHAALLPAFAACVLPDGVRPTMVSLLPPAAELPDSSLAHMVSVVVRALGDAQSAHVASVAGGIDAERLHAVLDDACAAGRPVCLLGTSLSFLHWLELLGAQGRRFELPAGSRLMDTGGYKGSGRSVPADALLEAYGEQLGIAPDHCINEYGMTELCSQQYDVHLRDRAVPVQARWKAGPPWLRTRIVDPETLEPVPDGTPGLLQHFDLANLGSVLAVQTEDVGVRSDGRVRLLGRVLDAPPRGCSIAMDDLLRATRAPRS